MHIYRTGQDVTVLNDHLDSAQQGGGLARLTRLDDGI